MGPTFLPAILIAAQSPIVWVGFVALILVVLALDLGVFNRNPHVVESKEAIVWTCIWIGLAAAFAVFVWYDMGAEKGIEFITGFVIEKSLSVDNLFVMVLVFTSFGVPRMFQHRVLFWGILGALVSRGTMIFLGVQLIERFHFVIYAFGAFLVFTGIRMAVQHGEKPDPRKNLVLRIFKKFVRTTDTIEGKHFLTRTSTGRIAATPLMVALVVVEAMDIVFAVDSIPAIFAVTTDPFIVFTSNIFAILGLRSLYFLLADVVERFIHLEIGLSVILVYVGVKMLLSDIAPIPTLISLGVILAILGITIVTSIIANRRRDAAHSGND